MSKTTRRQFGRLAAGAAGVFIGAPLTAAPKINSTVESVTIGAQSYSFRDRPLDAAIQGFKDTGLGLCELWQGHMERGHGNRRDGREELRQWRLSVSLDEFEAAGQKFREAGVDLYAYNYSFRKDFTDAEIERGFEMAKALGAKVMTASSNVTTSARVDPFAKKHKIRVGMHNHSNIRENEFATPDDFERTLKGRSSYIAINLDIGHFTAANFDAVDYIRKHHDDIVTLHLKDRKRNQGDNVPFGQGDTPIKEVLALLRERKSALPANIEYEYKGGDSVEEVAKCFQYCKRALES